MTTKERIGFKQINIAISKGHNKADATWDALTKKYIELDGHAQCSPVYLMKQISESTKTTEAEKIRDLSKLFEQICQEAKFTALLDIMTAMERGYY